MLATVIVDTYTKAEALGIAGALDELASPTDSWGWSSSGIYCFWDPVTRERYYVGMAIDIPLRFRHHNHLAGCPEQCCKREWIEEFFNQREKLGFSVALQSPLSQGVCGRWQQQNPGAMAYIAEEFGYMSTEEAIEMVNEYVDGRK